MKPSSIWILLRLFRRFVWNVAERDPEMNMENFRREVLQFIHSLPSSSAVSAVICYLGENGISARNTKNEFGIVSDSANTENTPARTAKPSRKNSFRMSLSRSITELQETTPLFSKNSSMM